MLDLNIIYYETAIKVKFKVYSFSKCFPFYGNGPNRSPSNTGEMKLNDRERPVAANESKDHHYLEHCRVTIIFV